MLLIIWIFWGKYVNVCYLLLIFATCVGDSFESLLTGTPGINDGHTSFDFK